MTDRLLSSTRSHSRYRYTIIVETKEQGRRMITSRIYATRAGLSKLPTPLVDEASIT